VFTAKIFKEMKNLIVKVQNLSRYIFAGCPDLLDYEVERQMHIQTMANLLKAKTELEIKLIKLQDKTHD